MEKKEMTLNEYQKKAMTTCMDSCENFSYMFLNLVGEVGELASKVAKQIRKENISIGTYESNRMCFTNPSQDLHECDRIEHELMLEAGDILWQLSGLCSIMGWDLDDVAWFNLDKLAARKAIGTIDGNGDGVERGK